MTTESKVEMAGSLLADEEGGARPFYINQIVRLSTFQIGSAMADILTAGVWNRIMISDFGIPAWPVGLLLAMKYLLAPISIWVGNRSDNIRLWGWYRTPYIWLGRGLLLSSFPVLGAGTVMLEQNQVEPLGWVVAILSFFLFSIGVVLSGSPYLALVRDSAPKSKQGVAIGMVETVLITMFPVIAVLYSRLLVTYDPILFWRLILIVTVVAGFFWYFAIASAEKRNQPWLSASRTSRKIDLVRTFRMIWSDRRTRLFFLFLFVATFSAWLQDNILEPYGADVFRWEIEQTTRLTSYWGTATVVILVGSLFVWRKRRPEDQTKTSRIGLIIMAFGMATIMTSALSANSSIFLTGLVLFGAGFGLYTFGGLSLMVAMSPDPHSGAYLGLWTVAILVSKGLGTLMGGVIRDLFLFIGSDLPVAYAVIFLTAAAGLMLAAIVVTKIDVVGFVGDSEGAE